LKNVVVNWYGEITLEILNQKPIKSIRNKSPFKYFDYALGIEILKTQKNSFQKDFSK
jgi:hypothetical protein